MRPRGPTRASLAYEISGFPSDFLISALVSSDFRWSPGKYTDVRGGFVAVYGRAQRLAT